MRWQFLFAAVFFLLPVPGVAAQEPAPAPGTAATPNNQPAAAKPLWNITCSSAGGYAPMQCRMSQELFVAETGKRILAVTIDNPAKPQEVATMLFALPHGLYLPAGTAIKIDDGEARKLDIQTSDANGVYAGIPLDETLLAAVKRGRKIMLTMTGTNRKTFDVPIGLEGFTAAFTRIMALR